MEDGRLAARAPHRVTVFQRSVGRCARPRARSRPPPRLISEERLSHRLVGDPKFHRQVAQVSPGCQPQKFRFLFGRQPANPRLLVRVTLRGPNRPTLRDRSEQDRPRRQDVPAQWTPRRNRRSGIRGMGRQRKGAGSAAAASPCLSWFIGTVESKGRRVIRSLSADILTAESVQISAARCRAEVPIMGTTESVHAAARASRDSRDSQNGRTPSRGIRDCRCSRRILRVLGIVRARIGRGSRYCEVPKRLGLYRSNRDGVMI